MSRTIIHKVIAKMSTTSLFDCLPDERYLPFLYWARTDKRLNLKYPRTYNEKLQWLKLYDRKPIYTTMVDKFEAKQYIAEQIGQEYIIPTLGVWDRFDDIDFDTLPNQFVLKCTHDSGGLVIVRDKTNFNLVAAKKKIEKSLKTNYYFHGREWPYKDVKPRIIAESYIEDAETEELRDYKWFCFHGVAKILGVFCGRSSDMTTADFFDADYCPVDMTRGYPRAAVLPEKPKCFEKMKQLAEKLSADMPHLRVDFYEVNGNIYVGELTFFPSSGFAPIEPELWDERMGSWITLPTK